MQANTASRITLGALALLLGCLPWGCTREPAAPEASSERLAEVTPPPASIDAADADEDALVLLVEAEPDFGNSPLAVQFSVESLVADEMEGPKFTWDFGDGSPPSHEASPKHTYQRAGDYIVTIRVVDAAGLHGWDEMDIEVTAPDSE